MDGKIKIDKWLPVKATGASNKVRFRVATETEISHTREKVNWPLWYNRITDQHYS